jgi:hypothetical protein
LLIPFVLVAAQNPGTAPPAPPAPVHNQYFSGYVTELTADTLTVSRKGNGKEMVHRVFAIDAQTKVEGMLKLNARVTVRYEAVDTTNRAIRIIVR